MQYRPDIDGLRAVAVLPVVLYHAGFPGFSGGFVGVDVFFVISGFLITRIIHEEMLAGQFSLLKFYERRARRILPALFTVLVAAKIAGWVLLAPVDYDHMSQSAISTLLFVSNIWFWQNSGSYFDGAVEYLPLLHTWSLAVEEQFYILFPLLLLILVRFGRTATLGVALVIAFGSFVLAVWATPRMPSASFFLLPTRVWELGVGSLLALGLGTVRLSQVMREVVAAGGLIAILASVTMFSGSTVFPGYGALPPVLGAAALIWVGMQHGPTLVGRFLSWRPMVAIGLVSYSLYLWHWPIMAFARNIVQHVEFSTSWQVGTVVLSVAAAWASLNFVEKPFRTGRARRIGRRGIFGLSAGGMVALAIASGLVISTGGAYMRFSDVQLAKILHLKPPAKIKGECRGGGFVQTCTYGDTSPETLPNWLLWGDSHGEIIKSALGELAARQGKTFAAATRGGCLPMPDIARSDMSFSQIEACNRSSQSALAFLQDSPHVEKVFLAARWPLYIEGDGLPIEGLARFTVFPWTGQTKTHAPSENPRVVARALSETVADLRDMGKQVVLVGSVPELPWDIYTRLRDQILFQRPPPNPNEMSWAKVRMRQEEAVTMLERVAEMHGAIHVPLAEPLCADGCPTYSGETPFYSDNNHLIRASAQDLVTPILAEALFPLSTSTPEP